VKKTTGGQFCAWASRSPVSPHVPSEPSEQAQAEPLSDERHEAQAPVTAENKAILNWPAPANHRHTRKASWDRLSPESGLPCPLTDSRTLVDGYCFKPLNFGVLFMPQ